VTCRDTQRQGPAQAVAPSGHAYPTGM
jgi:hypothetical protein